MSVLERCPSYRESNKGSKERQGPTLGVCFREVSVKRELTVYLLVSGMTSSSTKLYLLFLRPFWCSKKPFCNRFWQEKDLTENLEAIWTISFEIRVKIEIQECLSLSRQVCFRCKFCVSEVHFNLAFYHQKLSRTFL